MKITQQKILRTQQSTCDVSDRIVNFNTQYLYNIYNGYLVSSRVNPKTSGDKDNHILLSIVACIFTGHINMTIMSLYNYT